MILSMFLYDLVNVTLQMYWSQYELYWCRYEVKADEHQYSSPIHFVK